MEERLEDGELLEYTDGEDRVVTPSEVVLEVATEVDNNRLELEDMLELEDVREIKVVPLVAVLDDMTEDDRSVDVVIQAEDETLVELDVVRIVTTAGGVWAALTLRQPFASVGPAH